MSRKILAIGLIIVLLGAGLWVVGAQEEEAHPIITTAQDVVGVGTYVAAEAFATPGSEEHPEPMVYILPYAIHPNMHVLSVEEFAQPEALVEGFTFEWSLDGADLLATGQVAIFIVPDAGKYTLTLTATDDAGNVGEVSWEVAATTYIGSGYLGETADNQCISCHEDKVEAWMLTGHSDMLVRGLDGTLSSHYGEGCISCHTTGFSIGENGGFDDVAMEAGWEFPEELTAGGWDAFVAEFPGVAALANIQCESCHGPGAMHVPAASDDDDEEDSMGPSQPGPIGDSLAYGVCAQCHAEDPYHVFPQQWELSGHGEKASRAFTYPTGEGHEACVRCHSGSGYIDFAAGMPEEEQRIDYQPITCAVCHDPHDVSNPNQLRTYDVVVLPDGTEITDAGANATCMSCHNARVDVNANIAGALEGGRFGTPHYSTGAELMHATGGYTWGEVLPSSGHDDCVGCHMADTPGTDMPGRHEVGEHTFTMTNAEGVENIAACQECHVGATTFAFESSRDYDGDGAYESVQDEVAGLQEALTAALVEAGVGVLGHYPYFEIPEGAGEDLLGGVYNLKFSQSGGSAIHNFRYTVALLQLSVEKLGGEVGDPLPAR
jgi:DNA gyrase inhibitor GyrI